MYSSKSNFRKKISKLYKKPHLFFRDYLNNKYPVTFDECEVPRNYVKEIVNDGLKVCELELDLVGKVDLVFTWVDNTDPTWLRKYDKYKCKDKRASNAANNSARFSDHDELKYSLSAAIKYLSWVNNVYIVTDDQRPKWFKETERLRLIDHREIIDDVYLPTFNSHVIEACLHKIPDLSEHFIYFNDDVFVARELPKSHFFKGKNISSLFLTHKSVNALLASGQNTHTLSASRNSIDLIYKKYGISVDKLLTHTYIPLTKQKYKKVWCTYEPEIKSFMRNKFRTNNDINLATFLVPWITYLDGKAVVARDICYYFNIRKIASKRYYKELTTAKANGSLPHSFCANDFSSENVCNPDYHIDFIKAVDFLQARNL